MNDLISPFPLNTYLHPTNLIDSDHPKIQGHALHLHSPLCLDTETVKRTFHFVRDEIAHSYDIQSNTVTAKASEVLHDKESICYGKSHLLAALLRASGIPSGICYQRLTLGDTPESGYCIHALNTVYIYSLHRWIRLDARGNKPGVNAQFSVDAEKLAFHVRPELGEIDYSTNYNDAHPIIQETLERYKNEDCMSMYLHHLPTQL